MGYICHNVMAAAFPDPASAKSAFLELSRRPELQRDLALVGSFVALGSDGSKEGWESSDEGDRRRSLLASLLPPEARWADFLIGGDDGEEGPDENHSNPSASYGSRDYSDPASWPEQGFDAIVIAAVSMDFPWEVRRTSPDFWENTVDISEIGARFSELFPGEAALLPGRANGYKTALACLGPRSFEQAAASLSAAMAALGDAPFCALALLEGDWSSIGGNMFFENNPDFRESLVALAEARRMDDELPRPSRSSPRSI